jgi:micrococcal nuclease
MCQCLDNLAAFFVPVLGAISSNKAIAKKIKENDNERISKTYPDAHKLPARRLLEYLDKELDRKKAIEEKAKANVFAISLGFTISFGGLALVVAKRDIVFANGISGSLAVGLLGLGFLSLLLGGLAALHAFKIRKVYLLDLGTLSDLWNEEKEKDCASDVSAVRFRRVQYVGLVPADASKEDDGFEAVVGREKTRRLLAYAIDQNQHLNRMCTNHIDAAYSSIRNGLFLTVGFMVALASQTLLTRDRKEEWTGKVLSVINGDTILVERAGQAICVRIAGIDAPEEGQPYGEEAAEHLRRLLLGESVSVESTSSEEHGQMVGRVKFGKTKIADALVGAGLAWHYKRYDTSSQLAEMENTARLERRGLWVMADLVPPWRWRLGNGQFRKGHGQRDATTQPTSRPSGIGPSSKPTSQHATNQPVQ